MFMLKFLKNLFKEKKQFSKKEIVVIDGSVNSAPFFLQFVLNLCENFCHGNDKLSMHVIELYSHVFTRFGYKTISMHISTAITLDNIITSKYKIKNNNDECTNFKETSCLIWRNNIVTTFSGEYVPVDKIGDIAYLKNVVPNGPYVKIGTVTKIGLFLCEIKM